MLAVATVDRPQAVTGRAALGLAGQAVGIAVDVQNSLTSIGSALRPKRRSVASETLPANLRQ